MKKILAFIICLEFASMPAYSIIVDEFAQKTLDKNLKITTPAKVDISDSFAEQSLDKNLKVKQVNYSPITDNFAEQNRNKNPKISKKVDYQEVIPKINNQKANTKKIVVMDNNSVVSIPIRIKRNLSSKTNLQEGDYIEFETVKDVTVNKKPYPAGTIVKARIETISLNKSMGVPSDLIIGNFSINGIPLADEISKSGANRSLWEYPCVYGLTWFFCVGLLFIPIRGGHAKIRTSETYTVYAEK